VLERHVLGLRMPDPANIIDADRANMIATEYDGTWGGARVVMASAEAWLGWVRGRGGEWPTEEDLKELAAQRHRAGAAAFHIRRRSKAFAIPAVDGTAWHFLLSCERDEGAKESEPSAAEQLGKALGVKSVVVGTIAGDESERPPTVNNGVRSEQQTASPQASNEEGNDWRRYVLFLPLI